MGYEPRFLNDAILSLPVLKDKHELSATALLLDYCHFSILFSKNRRLPVYTAVNINGGEYQSISRTKDVWKYDVRIPKSDHTDDSFYKTTDKHFHRGHIVRRLDPSWGNRTTASQAENDTFHFTNSSPQHRLFNTRIWLEQERNLLEKGSVAHGEKIVVFSGPVLSSNDKAYHIPINDLPFFMPMQYWKVVVWKKTNGHLYSVGFLQPQPTVVTQFLNDFEKARGRGIEDQFQHIAFKDGKTYQVPLTLISKLTGLDFGFKDIILPDVPKDGQELTELVIHSKSLSQGYKGNDKALLDIQGMIL
jgi:endonuclease G